MVPLIACLFLAAATALPTDDPVISKLSEERFQHVQAGDGSLHLVDTWLKASDLKEAARYSPDSKNVYHLFTRSNPTVSQPLLLGSSGLLGASNFDPTRRTVVLLHGWIDNILGEVNTVLIPAFLESEDVNIIAIDWSAGASTINYAAAVANTLTSGRSVASFINWLNQSTGSTPAQFHIVGHSLGGHQAGIIGRNIVNGKIAYITALDPAFPGWITNKNKLRADDAAYTEVIHTNAGLLGYVGNLGHADFYPNGGIDMPGCKSQQCDHKRGIYYLAESLKTGGFKGTRCATYVGALTGNCWRFGSLRMGGLVPKTGSKGIYYLKTNAASPFSRG